MEEDLQTVADFCEYFGWDVSTLSKEAKISYESARKAYYLQPITYRIARRIAEAISKEMKETINYGDIKWT